MKRIIRKLIHYIIKAVNFPNERLLEEIERNRILIAKSLIKEFSTLSSIFSLIDIEFSIFSQWGEDGIIQYIISKIPIKNETFIEFGVDSYRESNTRFLLVNNNWNGLIIDSNNKNIKSIRSSNLYWRHNLIAVCSFITKDNINEIISNSGIKGDIGLLSIDIDGNDYWVWKAIDVISPRIVIIEYNSLFGCDHAITIPYDEKFVRNNAHYSNLYFGASLPALCQLAKEKGYVFFGSNSAGTNAFFIRKDVVGTVSIKNCKDGFVESKIRESRDEKGILNHISGEKRIELIRERPVFDLKNDRIILLKELFT